MTTGLIIFFCAMAIAGSILWLKPSRRDQHLAKLRQQAIVSGLQLKQRHFEPQAAKTGIRDAMDGVSYSFVLPQKAMGCALKFRLVKQAGWDQENLPEGFSWHDQPDDNWSADQFSRLLSDLGDELLLLEVFEQHATMMVAESSAADAGRYRDFLQSWLTF